MVRLEGRCHLRGGVLAPMTSDSQKKNSIK